MTNRVQRNLCLMYAAGPGDVVKTFKAWDSGEDDSHQVAVTYSGQFFQLCKEIGAKGVVISSNPRTDALKTEQFTVENRPKWDSNSTKAVSGVSYHLKQLSYARGLIKTATKEGAKVLIAAESTGHLFGLQWHSSHELAIVPTIHCTLWPKFAPLGLKQRLFNLLDRNLFTKRASGILCISEDIRRQLQLIGGKNLRPIYRFRPCYRRETFETIPLPKPEGDSFSILFAGRLERNKGIFDLVEVCSRVKERLKKKVVWEIAGDGSKEQELRQLVKQRGFEENFHIHGYCRRPKMLELIGKSHAFIVPTRTEFEEGFNKVVAESVLNNRPVITSAVCPAIDDVKGAVIEAKPNSVADYSRAVERLVADSTFYLEKLSACKALQEQFYDQTNSWKAQLQRAVEASL